MTIDQRLRRTLHAVAQAMPETAAVRTPRRPRKRVALLLTALVVPLAAGGYVLGSEYVHEMPPTNALLAGDAHGERYGLVPGRLRDECGIPLSTVELVVGEWNTVGAEWDTAGVSYGETVVTWLSARPARLPGLAVGAKSGRGRPRSAGWTRRPGLPIRPASRPATSSSTGTASTWSPCTRR
ncbi:hypothetical protein GCM10028775_76960 [Catellatospora paridis]